MVVSHVEVLVEEPSMESALRLLLPKVIGNVTFKVYIHQCKHDLLMRLPDRLRGYSSWLPDDWRIIVVLDRDRDDCRELKARLEQMATSVGLRTRSTANDEAYQVVNRIAIEELEAWYFGDWQAVRAAYPKVPERIPNRAKFRDPDAIAGGTWEAFERIAQRAGYFKTGLRKIEAARSVAQHWRPEINRSPSFRALLDVLQELAAE